MRKPYACAVQLNWIKVPQIMSKMSCEMSNLSYQLDYLHRLAQRLGVPTIWLDSLNGPNVASVCQRNHVSYAIDFVRVHRLSLGLSTDSDHSMHNYRCHSDNQCYWELVMIAQVARPASGIKKCQWKLIIDYKSLAHCIEQNG